MDRYLDEHAESLTQYIILTDLDDAAQEMYRVGWGVADEVLDRRENRAG